MPPYCLGDEEQLDAELRPAHLADEVDRGPRRARRARAASSGEIAAPRTRASAPRLASSVSASRPVTAMKSSACARAKGTGRGTDEAFDSQCAEAQYAPSRSWEAQAPGGGRPRSSSARRTPLWPGRGGRCHLPDSGSGRFGETPRLPARQRQPASASGITFRRSRPSSAVVQVACDPSQGSTKACLPTLPLRRTSSSTATISADLACRLPGHRDVRRNDDLHPTSWTGVLGRRRASSTQS